MAAVTAALVGVFAFIILRVTAPQMTPVFTDLTPEDSAAIVKDLERQAIPYELKNDGAIVMVPRDQHDPRAHEARRRRPAQGRRRRLRDLRQVRHARRHQLRAEHQPSARAGRRARPHHQGDRPGAGRARASRSPRTAAVLARQGRAVGLDRAARARRAGSEPGARDPPSRRLRGQRHEAAAGLGRRRGRQPAGRRRASGPEAAIGGTRTGTPGELRAAPEGSDRIDRLLGGRSGPRARAAFRRIRLQPHHRDVRQVRSRRPRAALQPDARGILPAATARKARSRRQRTARRPARPAKPARTQAARDQSKKSEEIVNYEISRSTKTEVTEGGRVKRVSAAVLVDGSYAKNDKGESVYQPRAKEELDRIAALVRTAIGFDQKRGDQIEVVNLRFAEAPAAPIQEPSGGFLSFLQFTKDDIMRGDRARRDGAARPRGGAVRGAAAGAAHPDRRRSRGRVAALPGAPALAEQPAHAALPDAPMPPAPARPPR